MGQGLGNKGFDVSPARPATTAGIVGLCVRVYAYMSMYVWMCGHTCMHECAHICVHA